MHIALYLLLLLPLCSSKVEKKVYLYEAFNPGKNGEIPEGWITTAESAEWRITAGKFPGDRKLQRGLQTTRNEANYAISRKLDEVFDTSAQPLVLQFSVKHEQFLDCGGGYIKLFGETFDPDLLDKETPFLIMFGPDICGDSKRVHLLLADYKGRARALLQPPYPATDQLTHLYTLVIRPDKV